MAEKKPGDPSRKRKRKKAITQKGAMQLMRTRTTILILLILVVGFGAVALRLTYLQIFAASELQQRAVDQFLIDTKVSAKRGTIYDAKGKVLAQSASVWQVVMAPAYFETNEQRRYVAKNLSSILDLEYEDVLRKTKFKDSYYTIMKRRIETDEREKLLKFIDKLGDKYDNLGNLLLLYDDYKRYYPYGGLASSVIGFTGGEDQGLEGVEYQYNDYLTGTPGRIITARDARSNEMPFSYEQNEDAKDGDSIVLTIDETVQSIAEKYLKQGIIDNKVANRGVCIIMDVNTGAIIAMAVEDGYDLNEPYELSEEDKIAIRQLPKKKREKAESAALSKMWRNKAISDTYYPGSVFKMCTASMALNEGKVTDNSTFFCAGSYQLYNENIGCHDRSGHGTQTFFQAIANSCNPAFIQIGNLVGINGFKNYYRAFGFADPTGIDLPGESGDFFFSDMGEVDLAIGSFGQGFSITPIQMITACASIANGGKVVQPYVVQSITDSNGNVVKNTETVVKRRVISEDVARQMCDYLEQNTAQGGMHNGYISGYRVGGKTGTSQKRTYTNGIEDYIASFCGFAPADNARVACLVFFDTPLGDYYYGSQVSAPVFVNIMSEVLPYLEIQAEYTEAEQKYVDTVAGSYVGLSVKKAEKAVKKDGFTSTVRGSGDTVVAQIPSTASKIPNGGNVVLYTDDESTAQTVTVPGLVGLPISAVNEVASAYGLNVSISGETENAQTISNSQSIAEGEQVPEGTVITVKFGGATVVGD